MTLEIKPGAVVLLKALDEIEEHVFKVFIMDDRTLTGVALTGPLAGSYGEPDIDLVKRVLWQEDE